MGERRHSTALALVRPRLSPGREDPCPAKAPQPTAPAGGGLAAALSRRDQGRRVRARNATTSGVTFRVCSPKPQRSGRDWGRRAICAAGAPGADQPPPSSPKGRDESQARGLRTPSGERRGVTGPGARARAPGCRRPRSEGRTHRSEGLSWVVRAAVKE